MLSLLEEFGTGVLFWQLWTKIPKFFHQLCDIIMHTFGIQG
jgi:hypothetical protein